MIWVFERLAADGAKVGVVAVEGMLLVMKRKPFVNKFDDKDLVGVGEPREGAAVA